MEHLGDSEAVLVVDETGFLKQGVKSVGVVPRLVRQPQGDRETPARVGVPEDADARAGRGIPYGEILLEAGYSDNGPPTQDGRHRWRPGVGLRRHGPSRWVQTSVSARNGPRMLLVGHHARVTRKFGRAPLDARQNVLH